MTRRVQMGFGEFLETFMHKEIDFAIRVADEAKIPVHIFHLKIRGKPNWGTVGRYVAEIEAARARGLDVTANQYPYTAMQHGWSAFFPVWARDGGPQKFAEILRDPALRRKINTVNPHLANTNQPRCDLESER